MLRVKVKTRAVWELLARKNMTQNELGRRAEVSSGHLSQLINGERFPSPAVRQRLMNALAPVDFDDIFEIKEESDGRGNGANEPRTEGASRGRAADSGAADRTGVRQG